MLRTSKSYGSTKEVMNMFKTYYLLSIVANICTIILFIIVVGYVFYVCIRSLRIDTIRRKADKLWKELENDNNTTQDS